MQTACFIDGAFVPARSGATFAVTNPATDAAIAQVADGGAVRHSRPCRGTIK